MKTQSNQLNVLLRSAVLAALPLASACTVATPSVPSPSTPPKPSLPAEPSAPPDTEKDRCFGPPIRTQETLSINPLVNKVNADTSYARCVSLCEQAARAKVNPRRGRNFNPKRIENFKVSSCSLNPEGNQYRLSCEATFNTKQTVFKGGPKCPVPGRMPAGLHAHQAESHTALGHYFAEMTAMESAAVTAFRYLVRELQAYQAPTDLIQAAEAAINEEIQHAKLAGLLAKAHEAEIPTVVVDDFQLRSLFEIALENAVEGCVHETFAAACGLWQQQRAEDELFRTVIAHVTEDECRHAQLSWAIHEWVMPQLSTAEQARIRQAQVEAVEQLGQGFQQASQPEDVQRALGLPNAVESERLMVELRRSVWS